MKCICCAAEAVCYDYANHFVWGFSCTRGVMERWKCVPSWDQNTHSREFAPTGLLHSREYSKVARAVDNRLPAVVSPSVVVTSLMNTLARPTGRNSRTIYKCLTHATELLVGILRRENVPLSFLEELHRAELNGVVLTSAISTGLHSMTLTLSVLGFLRHLLSLVRAKVPAMVLPDDAPDVSLLATLASSNAENWSGKCAGQLVFACICVLGSDIRVFPSSLHRPSVHPAIAAAATVPGYLFIPLHQCRDRARSAGTHSAFACQREVRFATTAHRVQHCGCVGGEH